MNINNALKEHFEDIAGSSYGNLNDAMYGALSGLSYSGTVNDMLNAYLYDLGYDGPLAGKFSKLVNEVSNTKWADTTAIYPLERSLLPLKGEDGAGTFTRASSRTGFDRVTGDLVTYANDEPHFGELGLLVEETRTNQVTSTTPLASAGWSTLGTSAALEEGQTVEACPGRTGTAGKLTIGPLGGGAALCGPNGFASADSAIGCASFYVLGEGSSVGKTIDIMAYDITALAVLGIDTFTLTDQPQRIDVTGSATTAGNGVVIAAGYIQLYGGSSTLAEGDYFYIDVGQYETGEGPSTPILTTGTAATRVADTLTLPTSVLPAYSADYSIALTINLIEGSTSGHGIYSADDEVYRRAIVDASDHKYYTVHPNAVASTNVFGHDTAYRVITSVDVDGDINTYANGSLEMNTTAAAFSGTMTAFYLGAYVGGSQPLHGWVKDFRTYSKALSATEVPHA